MCLSLICLKLSATLQGHPIPIVVYQPVNLPNKALANHRGKNNIRLNIYSDEQMPDGAVIIAAITSCTNTSNPRNVVAAALVAKKANQLGLVRKPWVKTSFAPGSKVAKLYLESAGLLPELGTA